MERNGEFWRIEFRRTIQSQISENRTEGSAMFEGVAAATTAEDNIWVGGNGIQNEMSFASPSVQTSFGVGGLGPICFRKVQFHFLLRKAEKLINHLKVSAKKA